MPVNFKVFQEKGIVFILQGNLKLVENKGMGA